MAYLSSIINAVEAGFHISVQGDYYPKKLINGIRFITDNDIAAVHLKPNILYLADYAVYPDLQLHGDLFLINCNDKKPDTDCIWICENPGLLNLYNVIFESIFSYQNIQNDKLTLFNALHSDSSIEKLLHNAYAKINNPIVVLDSSYTVLASYPPLNDEDNIEKRNNKLYLNENRILDMKSENIINHIAHSVYPFVTRTKDYNYNWVFQSIRIKNSIIGYICIRCMNRDLTDDELEYVYILTQMISIQMQRNDGYRNLFDIRQENFFRDLFLNHFKTPDAVKKEMVSMHLIPKKYFYIISCGFTEQSSKLLGNNYYCLQLTTIFPNGLTSIYGNHFVTLLTTDELDFFNDQILARLEAFLTMNHMKAAISYVFEDIMKANHYFSQSVSQISSFLLEYSESPIAFYHEYFLKHVIELSKDYATIEASVEPSILSMHKYDRENKTDYIRTLGVYLKNNRSSSATAKALFIHKSTLFYRFDKMKELFNLNLEDSDSLFAYEYSLRVIKILNE